VGRFRGLESLDAEEVIAVAMRLLLSLGAVTRVFAICGTGGGHSPPGLAR